MASFFSSFAYNLFTITIATKPIAELHAIHKVSCILSWARTNTVHNGIRLVSESTQVCVRLKYNLRKLISLYTESNLCLA